MEKELTSVNVEKLNANPKKEINFFDDEEYRFLSNMYPCKVVLDDIEYQTSEAAFHAGKFKEKKYKLMLTNLKTKPDANWKSLGKKAKQLGQKNGITKQYNLLFDSDAWNNGEGQKAMLQAVRAKFKNPDLAKKLLKTGDAILIEGTFWNDRIWGVGLRRIKDEDGNIIGYKGSGKNQLGEILMKVRDELKKENSKEIKNPEVSDENLNNVTGGSKEIEYDQNEYPVS